MYKVNAFKVCQITGFVDVNSSYDISGNNYQDNKSFTCVDNANRYINSAKRTWLLLALEKFIIHKKFIIEGNQDKNPTKLEALKKSIQSLELLHKLDLQIICKQILLGEKYFRAILPVPSNPSREAAEKILDDIISFCKIELNPQS